MRFLKTKVEQAQRVRMMRQEKAQAEAALAQETSSSSRTRSKIIVSQKSPQKHNSACEDGKATKNIAQNFGRIICTFAVSDIAAPYLIPILEKENLNINLFKEFMNSKKKCMAGLVHFREALLVHKTDSSQVQGLKRAFQAIGEIFIKYFSINWIFNGKVNYKKAYLKYRFKMLRRIKNPELFTYIR